MKTASKLFGTHRTCGSRRRLCVIALVLAIGFVAALSMAGCDNGNGPSDITYAVSQIGGTANAADTTGIEFAFSGSIDGLNVTAADITVGGAAAKGSAAFAKSGDNWLLAPITVNAAGEATVKITKSGIEAAEKTVLVYKEGQMAPEYWAVIWNLNGGNAGSGLYPAQTVKGTVLAKPSPDPAKTGNTFGGWYTDAGLTAEYNFANTVTADLSLYAKWNASTGNLTLAGTVSISPSGTVTVNTPLTASYNGTDTAVTFAWHKQGTAAAVATGATYTPTETGSYTVTASAAGYNPKTSNAVTVPKRQ